MGVILYCAGIAVGNTHFTIKRQYELFWLYSYAFWLTPETFSVTSDEIKKISNPLVTLTHEKSRQEKEVSIFRFYFRNTFLRYYLSKVFVTQTMYYNVQVFLDVKKWIYNYHMHMKL